MTTLDPIDQFLQGSVFAVVGASGNRQKYGNKVLMAYLKSGYRAIPVNPTADEIEGQVVYPNLSAIAEPVHGVSVITPPSVTEKVVREAIDLGIQHIWLQPGAESETAIRIAQEAGVEMLHSGPCLLVALALR